MDEESDDSHNDSNSDLDGNDVTEDHEDGNGNSFLNPEEWDDNGFVNNIFRKNHDFSVKLCQLY